jgi:dTMP kinase
MRGKYITFEGGEGCGKSTQALRLRDELEKNGIETLLTREPGGTVLSEKIRSLLKDESEDPPCDRGEVLLFLAARAQLVDNVIRPALEEGKWVICDRFRDSTLAYQGYGRGLPLDFLAQANEFACDSLQSDLTLLLDVPPEIARRRMRKREADTGTCADRIELAGDDFHERLRRGFAELAKADAQRIVAIDASGDENEVWEQIWKSTKRFL